MAGTKSRTCSDATDRSPLRLLGLLTSLCIMFPLVGECDQSDCNELKQIVRMFASRPLAMRGPETDSGTNLAQVVIPESYQCIFTRSNSPRGYWLICVWLAQDYAHGHDIFQKINDIVAQCSFVISFNRLATEPNGHEESDVAFSAAVTRHRRLSMTIEHNRAMLYRAIAGREVTLNILFSKEGRRDLQ